MKYLKTFESAATDEYYKKISVSEFNKYKPIEIPLSDLTTISKFVSGEKGWDVVGTYYGKLLATYSKTPIKGKPLMGISVQSNSEYKHAKTIEKHDIYITKSNDEYFLIEVMIKYKDDSLNNHRQDFCYLCDQLDSVLKFLENKL